jgi:hypothetical protein
MIGVVRRSDRSSSAARSEPRFARQFSSRVKSLKNIGSIGTEEIARIRSAANRTLLGIKDMRKLNRHVEKQVKTTRSKLVRKCAQGDATTAARAVAEIDAEAAARAGLERLTPRQRRATVRKLASGDPTTVARAVAAVDAEGTARAGLEALGLPEEEIRRILARTRANKS